MKNSCDELKNRLVTTDENNNELVIYISGMHLEKTKYIKRKNTNNEMRCNRFSSETMQAMTWDDIFKLLGKVFKFYIL